MNVLPRTTDLFVIGGGPAGLAAALAARRRGLDVTLADCRLPPIDKACGEGIMPDGLAAARGRSASISAPAGGHPFRGIRFCDGDSVAQADFPNGHGLGLRRTALHQLMVEQRDWAGVRLAWGVVFPASATRASLPAIGWCAPAGSPAPMAATRRYGAGRGSMPAIREPPLRLPPPLRDLSLESSTWRSTGAIGCQLYVTPVAARDKSASC